MGSVIHPVGSLPPSAYWLRRLLVLLLVALLVVGGLWLLGAFGGGRPAVAGPADSPSSSPVASTGTPSATSTTHSPTTTATTSASKSTSTTTSTASAVACPDSAIKVLALTGEATFATGSPARLTVEVTNHGSVPCKRDLGQAALELIVSSSSTRVWSSDDCNPGGGHAVVTLRAGQTFATTVSWDRQTSAPGCPSGKPKAAAGTYTLVARNLTLRSAPTSFALA